MRTHRKLILPHSFRSNIYIYIGMLYQRYIKPLLVFHNYNLFRLQLIIANTQTHRPPSPPHPHLKKTDVPLTAAVAAAARSRAEGVWRLARTKRYYHCARVQAPYLPVRTPVQHRV